MVVIRLSRKGAKKRPFYRVVVMDSRYAPNSGNYIERLGTFDPTASGAAVRLHLDYDRIIHWQKLGAQLSKRVKSLMKEARRAAAGLSGQSTTAKADQET